MLDVLLPALLGCDQVGSGWTCSFALHGGGHTGRSGGGEGPVPDAAELCRRSGFCDTVLLTEPPGPARVTAADLAAEAAAAIGLPAPVPRSSPEPRSYVGLPTFLWVSPADWTARSATVSMDGRSVTLTGRPSRVVWDVGEAVLTCAGPGPAGCSHTFSRSSLHLPGGVYPISATVYYSAAWTCAGSCDTPGGSFGELPATGRTTLRVSEIQALAAPTPTR